MSENYFRYTDEKCPVCGEGFKPDDDIVVCPVCGTPHHRACYKNNGECANNELHSTGFRWEPAKKAQENPEPEQNTAPDFGNPFFQPNQEGEVPPVFPNLQNPLNLFPKELDEGVLTEEAAEFVQLKGIRYIQKFFYCKSGKRTWNWAAFLFAPYWFFYRKLHKVGAVFLAFALALSIIPSLLPPVRAMSEDMNTYYEKYYNVANSSEMTQQEAETILSELAEVFAKNKTATAIMAIQAALQLAFHLAAGLMADKLYYREALKQIRKIKAENPDIDQQKLMFFKKGGITMTVTICVLLGVQILTMTINNMPI